MTSNSKIENFVSRTTLKVVFLFVATILMCIGKVPISVAEDKNTEIDEELGVSYILTKKVLSNLKPITKRPKDKQITQTDLDKLEKIVNEEYLERKSFIKAIATLIGHEYDHQDLDKIANAAKVQKERKKSAVKAETDSVQTDTKNSAEKAGAVIAQNNIYNLKWGGEECGCVRDFKPSVVYGLPPFLLGENNNDDNKKIDFSILSRIAYYPVSLDDYGKIPEELEPKYTKGLSEFVRVAHKYRSNVDVVIHKSDWKNTDKESFFRQAIKTITQLLQPETTTFFDDVKTLISLGGARPNVADGVTIHFEEYVGEDKYFFDFINYLNTELDNTEEKYNLNIMLSKKDIENSMNECSKKIKAKKKELKCIHELVSDKKEGDDVVDLFIVQLGKQTSKNKKELRKTVEDNFSGYHRANMLRKIIPVISPVGHYPLAKTESVDQFYDDLIYFKNNFKGAGFFPLPLSLHEDAKLKVLDVYETKEHQDWVQQKMTELCKIQCPNRWWFRIGTDVLLVSWLVFILMAIYYFCDTVTMVKKYKLPFAGMVLITIAVIFPWFACDPFMKGNQTEFLIGVLFVGVILVAMVMIRRMRQSRMP